MVPEGLIAGEIDILFDVRIAVATAGYATVCSTRAALMISSSPFRSSTHFFHSSSSCFEVPHSKERTPPSGVVLTFIDAGALSTASRNATLILCAAFRVGTAVAEYTLARQTRQLSQEGFEVLGDSGGGVTCSGCL